MTSAYSRLTPAERKKLSEEIRVATAGVRKRARLSKKRHVR